MAVAPGCQAKTTGRSNLSTTIEGRTVKASLDGGGFISIENNVAAIEFSAGKLVVGKTSVTLDGREIAEVPEEAKQVTIDYTAGKLSITADGTAVPVSGVEK
jgi:hypothetical protein